MKSTIIDYHNDSVSRDEINIIAGQNRAFYNEMKTLYPLEMEVIS